MSGVCRAANAMLDGYLLVQAYAEDGRFNFQQRLNECSDDAEVAALFVGVLGVAERLRGDLARERGVPVEVLDEELIGALMVEGALS